MSEPHSTASGAEHSEGSVIDVSSEAAEAQSLDEQYDFFLKELGWRDWSAVLEQNADRDPQGIDVSLPMRRKMLKNNARRYGIYNATRKLAVEVIWLVSDYLGGEREYPLDEQVTRQNFVQLIVRMLGLQPNNPPVELPTAIQSMPDAGEREEAAWEYDYEVTRRNMVEHIREVVADLLETVYGSHVLEPVQKARRGEELDAEDERILADYDIEQVEGMWARFEQLVSRMMHVHYLEPYFGQTPLLGEALLATALKYALDNSDVPLLVMLYRCAGKAGVNIHNHIGVTNEKLLALLSDAADQANRQNAEAAAEAPSETDPNRIVRFETEIRPGSWLERTNQSGTRIPIEIENGDILVYRSRTKLAGEIGFAAMPSWHNWRGILRHRLWWGSFTGMALHLEGDAANDGLDAAERIRGRLQHKHWLVPGYNHTGAAKIFKSKIGLQQHRAVDAYPDGGIRIVGMNQFAHNGPQMRFAVVKADPRKFYEHAKKYRARHGYSSTAWEGRLASVDSEGSVEQEQEAADWPTMIRREEYEALHDAPQNAGETDESIARWKEEVLDRMTDLIIEKYLLDWGIHFATGFINVVGGLYCAQTPVMAMLQATGIDLQTYRDHFSLGVRIMHRLGLAGSLPLESRIVAPSGTYVQPFQRVHGVNFPRISPLQQAAAETAPRYVAMNPDMTRILYDPADEESAALIDEWREDGEFGYFGERVSVVSAAADSLRNAVQQIEGYAGFKQPGILVKVFRFVRQSALWWMGW